MLLLELKKHLQNNPGLSLLELSLKFKTEADVLRGMLSMLISKGHVRICMKTPQCGTQCTQCSTLTTEIYEWVNNPI